MKFLKTAIRKTLHNFGLDIQRYTPESSPFAQLLKGLEHFGIDMVLDVGANTGQFASELRLSGFHGDIISFEPLSTAHKVLLKTSDGDSRWKVHERSAIGDFDGDIEIYLAGNSVSSSVLPMLDLHASAAVGSAYISSEKVAINKLDTIATAYLEKASNPFLKIDTQGFEWQVLDGAVAILPEFRGVLCELSLAPLYANQRLWMDIIHRLESEGFTLWALQKGFVDPRNGRSLQMDGIFFRE